MPPNLDDWVWVQAMLGQAMLGVISTNVRQICLSYENGWNISAIIEHPCEEDIDDIQDIADETSIFIEEIKDRLSPCIDRSVRVSICSSQKKHLDTPNASNYRIIYRRKE